jgi:ribose transport system ATP-binding protein
LVASDPIVRMRAVDKRFGSLLALDSANFDVRQGEIHALLGVNGAGKSTLVNILSGVYGKDAGVVEVGGRPVDFATPRDAMDHGVATVHQHPELVPDLSGYENIFLGQEAAKRGFFKLIDREGMRRRSEALLARLQVATNLSAQVGAMPSVDREIVAILHALRRDDIKILILDEPTSTLTEREKNHLFDLMRSLKAVGIAIIFITHRLEEVFEIADRFTVFRGGRNVATLSSAEASSEGLSIAELMLDEKSGRLFPAKAEAAGGDVILEVRKLALGAAFADISFDARRGEIVGLFGLVGSGIDELAKTLFGMSKPDAGEIRLGGNAVRFSGPHDALQRGVFLVPGDRRTEGLTLTRDATFNTTLANLGRASWFGGLLRFRRNRREVASLARQTALNPPRLWQAASMFSGGNQQKIVIAKGLFCQAQVYIFCEPTAGVDIGARAKIYGLLRELSRTAAVVVMSSDCDEVHGLSDRVMALYRGRPALAQIVTVARDRLLAAGIMGAVA